MKQKWEEKVNTNEEETWFGREHEKDGKNDELQLAEIAEKAEWGIFNDI